MAKQPRVILPNTPHHIVQRGHNRNPVFIERDDYQYYLDTLWDWKKALGIKVYGWCLMTNHVHLLLDPGDKPSSISDLMKQLAARQTRYVNRLERRTGSLWDGRYKLSPIATDEYLLQCCRYVDLNPVKAGIVEDPIDYEWSSFRAKVRGEIEGNLDFDECYLGFKSPRSDYRTFVSAGISKAEYEFIRERISRNQLTGGNRFIDEVERRVGVRIEARQQGRPTGK